MVGSCYRIVDFRTVGKSDDGGQNEAGRVFLNVTEMFAVISGAFILIFLSAD